LTPETTGNYQKQDTHPSTPSTARAEPRSQPVIVFPELNLPEVNMPEIEMPEVEIDWASVGLGLVALMAVGGLIPFWIYIYFLYNPR
jgi:hypothetical protein